MRLRGDFTASKVYPAAATVAGSTEAAADWTVERKPQWPKKYRYRCDVFHW